MDERVGVVERSVVVAGVSAGALRASGRVMRERIIDEEENHIVMVLRARYLAKGDSSFELCAGLAGWLRCSG